MRIAHSVAVAGAVLTQCASAAVASYQVGGPVRTTSGTLTGMPGKNAPEVSAYLGIPFAYPPVGPRRWLAPERFKGDVPLNTTKFSADCPGTLSLGGGSGRAPGAVTEDCLYLSVWAPQKKAGDAPKAVLIWIYGGAFVGGGTSLSMSDGARLAAKEDVVVVAGNYRLSIFGFPGGPGLPDQNLGLLDQRMTVEWVRDNIAAFGGDPNKIVLFGESAGGDSVDLYSYAWTKDPIVKGFIAESGASTMCGLVGKQSYDSWKSVSSTLGCATDPKKELECMRGKSAADVQATAKALSGIFPPKFVPIPDGKVAFDDYFDRGDKGLFIKAPFIIGNNDRELGTNEALSDVEFICPAAQVVNSRRAAGVPVWRYRFYGGGPAKPGAKSTSNPASHGAEISYIFGTFATGGAGAAPSASGPTPEKLAASDVFQKVWAEFARDPVNGPKKHGWPVYDPKGDTLVRLMYQNETKISLIRGDTYDAKCVKSCKSAKLGGKGGVSRIGGGFGPLI